MQHFTKISGMPSPNSDIYLPTRVREKNIFALIIATIADAISYLIIVPTLFQYVGYVGKSGQLEDLSMGEWYGSVMGSFQWASLFCKPVIGMLSDRYYGFKIPYIWGLLISFFGGFLYFISSIVATSEGDDRAQMALWIMWSGRLLGGIGASNVSLGFAYVSKYFPPSEQTLWNMRLGASRTLGYALGAGITYFLKGFHYDTTIENVSLHFDDLNSVGLVIMSVNVAALLSMLVLFQEAPKIVRQHNDRAETRFNMKYISEILSLTGPLFLSMGPFFLPLFSLFVSNFNYQIAETAFAPAAEHALRKWKSNSDFFQMLFPSEGGGDVDKLNWSPSDSAAVLFSLAVVVLTTLFLYQKLKGCMNEKHFVIVGCCFSTIGYYLVWDWWKWKDSLLRFYVPLIFSHIGLHLMRSPTRTLFTNSYKKFDSFRDYHGFMAGMLDVCISLGGAISPRFVSEYVMRPEHEVEMDPPHRELTMFALIAPAFHLLELIFWSIRKADTQTSDDHDTDDDTIPLTNNSTDELPELNRNPDVEA